MTKHPLIACTTYRKTVDQTPPIEVYGLMPSYSQAVAAAGGIPVLVPMGLNDETLDHLLQRVDGVLVPGGGDVEPGCYGGNNGHPLVRDIDQQRDQAELTLIRKALEQEKPLFAICRGIQIMNVALGGSLWEDVNGHMPEAIVHDYFSRGDRTYLAHNVQVSPGSLLDSIVGTEPLPVNSLHHQGIRLLAEGLKASAIAPDGLVEAAEVTGHPFALGVQWHPENLVVEHPRMMALFRHFIQAAAAQ